MTTETPAETPTPLGVVATSGDFYPSIRIEDAHGTPVCILLHPNGHMTVSVGAVTETSTVCDVSSEQLGVFKRWLEENYNGAA